MLLDSTFLIDLLNCDTDAIDRLDDLADAATPVSFSVLTAFEVGVGLSGATQRERYDRVTDAMTVMPLTHADAQRATVIQRTLQSQGAAIGSIDALIAGTALERDEAVLTRNVDEFERVADLVVESY
ncbi:PIN domain-containing protein [Candidatus Halobonum tyrrellensis]|uniref:Ribonuclease VapC n=1 Tax=Candidatus Halobonum tyrrellensis G22 TaxID=1324957 RepID=V4J2V1_9EURY|nr:PIN domain-containing protein [Candidatus Halobonum tyrrellensis]ESP89722.1 PilT protein domain protein [Candidatus Halobonum tyrrellensis G22]